MNTDVTAADERFRHWMRRNLTRAADHFALTLNGEPVYGWRLRSIGAPVCGAGGERWLRVVSEYPEWALGDTWTGNSDANALIGLSKPVVLDVTEWDEPGWRRQRAEVMTLLPGQPCSPSDVLRRDLDLPDDWWIELRNNLDMLRVAPTQRINTDQKKVADRVQAAFGDRLCPRIDRWETVHGDLHWNNVMRPHFGLLDWEMWGRAPAGTDAAMLLCHSLLAPMTFQRINDIFADVLQTPDGHQAQLYAAAQLLRRTGRHDRELTAVLRRHASMLRKS
jgi:hypothetical protein